MPQFTYAPDFERPLLDLERKLADLRSLPLQGSVDFSDEIGQLEKKARKLQAEIFGSLSRWQIVQLARHSARPYALDYIALLFTDFVELKGDRSFGEDPAIVGGFARFEGAPVLVLGHQKGRGTKENMVRNFGMPRPEGFRKAVRLMRLAERFRRPVITFVDTPGAYPGIGAEERGQAQAIAECLACVASLGVPIISAVTGEGGSGGALAIGSGNRIVMLEHAIYSVITPEACSSILYRDAAHAERAADALKLTARDLLELGVADEVVKEALGGAHRDPARTAGNLGRSLRRHLAELVNLSPEDVVRDRQKKYRSIGVFAETRA